MPRKMDEDALRAHGAVVKVPVMAEFLQISRSQAYQLLREGLLPQIKVLRLGSEMRISVASLIAYAEDGDRTPDTQDQAS